MSCCYWWLFGSFATFSWLCSNQFPVYKCEHKHCTHLNLMFQFPLFPIRETEEIILWHTSALHQHPRWDKMDGSFSSHTCPFFMCTFRYSPLTLWPWTRVPELLRGRTSKAISNFNPILKDSSAERNRNCQEGKNKISSPSVILRGWRAKLVQHVHSGSQPSNPKGPSTLSRFCVTRHACGGQTLVHIKLILKKERKRVAVGLERWLNS